MRNFLYIISGICLLAACSKGSSNYTARIHVFNAVPDGTGFDVLQAGQTIAGNVTYGQTAPYATLSAITDSFGWRKTGATTKDQYIMTDLPNGNDYSLFFLDSTVGYKSFFIRDDWKQPMVEKKAYLRFIPLLIDAAELRLADDTNRLIVSSYRQFADFLNNSSLAAFNAADTFTNELRLVQGANLVTIDSLPNTVLLPGHSYTAYAIGVPGNTTTRKPKLILYEHK